MFDVQTILTYLTLISVPVGVAYHIMTLNNTRKSQQLAQKSQELATETRQAQLFMNLYEVYRSIDFRRLYYEIRGWSWTSYEDWREKYSMPNNPETSSKFFSVMGYFEGMGLLVKKGLVDVEMVDELLKILVYGIWEQYRDIIFETRSRMKIPHYLANYEYLYEEMKKREPAP